MSVKALPGSSSKKLSLPLALGVVLVAILFCVYFYSNLSAFGFKPIAAPGIAEATNNGMPPVFGKPTLSAKQIDATLAKVHSPAAGTGQALYDGSVKSGVNDTFAMAVFNAQSKYGTLGAAVDNKSLGDFSKDGQFIQYASWADSYTDFYKRVAASAENNPQVVLDYLYLPTPINPVNIKQERIDANEPDLHLVLATMKDLEQ